MQAVQVHFYDRGWLIRRVGELLSPHRVEDNDSVAIEADRDARVVVMVHSNAGPHVVSVPPEDVERLELVWIPS